MKRKLLTQMRSEWRSNIWMLVELVIVGLVVSGILMAICLLAYDKYINYQGYDLQDVYVGNVGKLPETSDEYVPYEDGRTFSNDIDVLLNNLRNNPYVEEVATGRNSMPYNYNYSGLSLIYPTADDVYMYLGNVRYFTPELVRLIKLHGPNGETTEQLAKTLAEGKWLISPFAESNESCNPQIMVGKDVYIQGDTTKLVNIGAVSYGILRNDYEGIYGGCIFRPMVTSEGRPKFPGEVVVRVKPGMGDKFVESLDPGQLAVGNVYFHNFQSIDAMRDNAQRSINNTVRDSLTCAFFLFVVVFLGFLGTFWFRTQQRVPEIALRMVNGATRRQIFARLISEGLIMLGVSVLIFAPIFMAVVDEVSFVDIAVESNIPKYIALAMTILLLAIVIVAGVWFPARRAMNIQPANALKDQ